MRVSPLHLIFTSGFIAVVVFAIDLLLVLSAPRIGVDLEASSSGLVQVAHVYRNSPAEKAGLVAGDLLVKVFDKNKNTVYLSQDTLLKDPDIFPTFALFNGFVQHQLKITRIFKNRTIYFQKIDSSYVAVKPLNKGSAKMLPMWYWNIKLMGIFILLIGAAIYAHNPSQLSNQLLFIASIGFLLAGVFYGINGSRELASPFPDWIQAIDGLKHFSLGCFSMTGIALLWVYPNRLACRQVVWGRQ